jgi:hypothetical protein
MHLAAASTLSVKKQKKTQKPTELSQAQVDAVVGMAHSDAHIEQRPKGSRLKICQGHKQKDLVFHLFEVLAGFVGAQPRNYITTLASGLVRSEWTFNTLGSTLFDPFRAAFYDDNGKKRLPPQLAL